MSGAYTIGIRVDAERDTSLESVDVIKQECRARTENFKLAQVEFALIWPMRRPKPTSAKSIAWTRKRIEREPRSAVERRAVENGRYAPSNGSS
jgi:hypothetical protein